MLTIQQNRRWRVTSVCFYRIVQWVTPLFRRYCGRWRSTSSSLGWSPFSLIARCRQSGGLGLGKVNPPCCPCFNIYFSNVVLYAPIVVPLECERISISHARLQFGGVE